MGGRKVQQPLGALGLRLIQLGQIDHPDPGQLIPHQPFRFQQAANALNHRFRRYRHQLSRGSGQFLLWQKAVPGRKIVVQFKQDPRLHTPGVIGSNPHFNGKVIHCAEGCFQSLIHQ